MDAIIAMGHFCDTHGPCVLINTRIVNEIPTVTPNNNVSVCASCESIQLDTIYVCEDDKNKYITSKSIADSNLSCILKDAVLRSLSIEMILKDDKTSGTIYFGDDNRGHVISHVFTLKDSYARGFKRKYCLLVIGKQQTSILSHYDFITKNLHRISENLQKKASKCNINIAGNQLTRSLRNIIEENNIFGQLHMWFVFIIRNKIYENIDTKNQTTISDKHPIDCQFIEKLRFIKKEMPDHVYNLLSYCILCGIHIDYQNEYNSLKYFKQLLPKNFKPIKLSSNTLKIIKKDDKWMARYSSKTPIRFPTLHNDIKEALDDANLFGHSLIYYVTSVLMHWLNICWVISRNKNSNQELYRTLGVLNCDLPLVNYWITQFN